MNIDLTQPWCTYCTTHSTGFYYYGKAKTCKVLDGTYKGSGIRWKLSQLHDIFEYSTWTTTVDQTFDTEEEAYSAEEILIPLSMLSDPYCLNMNAGGRIGKYQNHGKLFKQILSKKRALTKSVKTAKAKEKIAKLHLVIKTLKNGKNNSK
jgi:hypothetical protein